jgi:hypothetical protein
MIHVTKRDAKKYVTDFMLEVCRSDTAGVTGLIEGKSVCYLTTRYPPFKGVFSIHLSKSYSVLLTRTQSSKVFIAFKSLKSDAVLSTQIYTNTKHHVSITLVGNKKFILIFFTLSLSLSLSLSLTHTHTHTRTHTYTHTDTHTHTHAHTQSSTVQHERCGVAA